MLAPPTIVIFDMDGTTVRHISPWVLNVLEWLDDVSYKFGSFVTRRSGFRTKYPFEGIVNRGEVKKKRLLVHRAIHYLRMKEVEHIVEPCPKIIEVLDFIKARNIPMGIASNGLGKGYGHDILLKFDLQKYFQVAIFREDIEKAKPHPEAILRVTETLFLRPTERDVIWYIGDRWKDMQAAISAKDHLPCPIIPFAYGPNAALQAFIDGKLKPEQRLLSYDDLLNLLKKISFPTDN
jgi:phosphoglycolate phosphatase